MFIICIQKYPGILIKNAGLSCLWSVHKVSQKKDITQTQLKLFPNNLGLTSNLSHYGLNSMKSGRHREK